MFSCRISLEPSETKCQNCAKSANKLVDCPGHWRKEPLLSRHHFRPDPMLSIDMNGKLIHQGFTDTVLLILNIFILCLLHLCSRHWDALSSVIHSNRTSICILNQLPLSNVNSRAMLSHEVVPILRSSAQLHSQHRPRARWTLWSSLIQTCKN